MAGRSSKATPARRLAVEIGRAARVRDAYVRELVDARRPDSTLSDEDFAFAQVLAFGVAMCRGTLDELIDRSLNKPSDIRANVRDALRVSAYELLFLGKPAHVVADQGVELVRFVEPRAAGLGNAVLRRMCAGAAEFPWTDEGEQAARARKAGLPLWLYGRFEADLGKEAAAKLGRACIKPAPTYLVEGPDGASFAADLASQQAASLVDLGGSVLEIGAGRGTKTALLQTRALSELGRFADIHAVELHAFKARLLKERMAGMGVGAVTVYRGDATRLGSVEGLPDMFDCVFVDAPCSGTGTLRRHPEIRWRLTPADVDDMAALQLRMLTEAAGRVAPKGSLVYATCSLLSQENAEVVEAFLAGPEGECFFVEPTRAAFSEFEGCVTSEGFFASIPADGGPDGHFACVLRKG